MFTELPVGLVCQLPWDTQLSRTWRLWRPRGLLPGGARSLYRKGTRAAPRGAAACAPPTYQAPPRPSITVPWAPPQAQSQQGRPGPQAGAAAGQPTGAATAELREHAVHAFHTCTLENTPTLAVSTFKRWLHRCGLGAQHPVLCATHFPNLKDGSVLQLVFSVCFFKQHFVPFFWQNVQSIYKHFLYFLP